MSKQISGCPRPNFLARLSRRLSFLLLPLLATQFAHSANTSASGGRPSLTLEAPNRSVPEALAVALDLSDTRPAPSFALKTALAADSPATRIVHRRSGPIKGKTLALNTQEPARLELGKPVERELSGGQEHDYQIALTDGQYVIVVIEQRGIDVNVQLQERDGKVTTSFDLEYRDQGEEKAEMVAEATGSDRLTVRASSKSAPTALYVIRVAEIRTATKNDRHPYGVKPRGSLRVR